MIRSLASAIDNLFGRGEAVVTVPPLDGALRPNRSLDEATSRTVLDDVDCLAAVGDTLFASAGNSVFRFRGDAEWVLSKTYDPVVMGLSSVGNEGLAVALADGQILIEGGLFDGRRYRDAGITSITALADGGSELYVTNGSATQPSRSWQRDLLERNASGSVWRMDLATGTATQIADGLAWPAGLSVDGGGVVVSEAWKHRLVRLDFARPSRPPQVQYADLPAYPGRIARAADGYWLALFAPRSQLVEFILREPAYRKRMLAEVSESFWVAPKLRSGRSFYESLQGGGVKHLGKLKPWAPTMSAGLCVKLDHSLQPRFSLQSRADGQTHGVTSMAEHRGQLFVAAHGDGVIVSLPLRGVPSPERDDR